MRELALERMKDTSYWAWPCMVTMRLCSSTGSPRQLSLLRTLKESACGRGVAADRLVCLELGKQCMDTGCIQGVPGGDRVKHNASRPPLQRATALPTPPIIIISLIRDADDVSC